MGGYALSQETTKHKDQAEQLKQLFNEVQQGADQQVKETDLSTLDAEEFQDVKIDILNLPPRKEVHSKYASRTRLKLNRPIVRLLSVMIILLIIIISVSFIWSDELMNMIRNLQ